MIPSHVCAGSKQPLAGLVKSFTPVKVVTEKKAKPKREKVKADPAHVAKARELRDRYAWNNSILGVVLPAGKYEVSSSDRSDAPTVKRIAA